MKSREEQLTWAKQRALICVDVGHFSDAVVGLRADLAENPLAKGVMCRRSITARSNQINFSPRSLSCSHRPRCPAGAFGQLPRTPLA